MNELQILLQESQAQAANLGQQLYEQRQQVADLQGELDARYVGIP